MLSSCRPAPPPEPTSVEQSAERGPLKYTLTAAPPSVWIADPVTVTLQVRTPAEYGVSFPSAADFEKLRPTSLKDEGSAPQPDGSLLWTMHVVVEPMTSGPFEIPPLPIRYGKRPEAGTAAAFDDELITSGLSIDVRSALTSQDSIVAPRDITGIRAAPREPWPAWAWAVLIGGLLLASALLWWAVHAWLKRPRTPARPILPEIWALQALDDLAGRAWSPAWGPRDHYYRMSEVVRQYIERKFSLRAPEMTTEEFLRTLSRNVSAVPYDAGRLRTFLEACDLVKYAAFEPDRETADDALGTARAFIHSTAAAADERARAEAAAARARQAEGALPPRPDRREPPGGKVA